MSKWFRPIRWSALLRRGVASSCFRIMHPRFLLPSNVLWLVRSVLPVPDPSSRRRMICPRSHRPSSTSAPCPWNRLRHPSPTLRFKAPMRYATPSPRRIHALACLGPSRPALAHTSGRWRPPARAHASTCCPLSDACPRQPNHSSAHQREALSAFFSPR